MNRSSLGLRGAVRRVAAQRRSHNNALFTEGQEFDREGRLLSTWSQPQDGQRTDCHFDPLGYPREFHFAVSESADGGRTELQELPASPDLCWTMDALHFCSFRTGGAKYAETTFGPRGAPVRTVFRSAEGEDLSQLLYVCDGNGNVLEARETGGASLWFLAGQFRNTFRYDTANRVIEQSLYCRLAGISEQRLHHMLYRYNDHGDLLWATDEDNPSPPSEYEYEYEEQGNWTRQVMHHALGTDEVRRRIEYWSH